MVSLLAQRTIKIGLDRDSDWLGRCQPTMGSYMRYHQHHPRELYGGTKENFAY